MAVAAQVEQDRAADTFFAAPLGLANRGSHGMVGFRGRQNALGAGELDARRKALDLMHVDRFDQAQSRTWLTSGAMPW